MYNKSKNLSVIIITAGNISFISRCVLSVVNQLKPKDELIVVSKRNISPFPWPIGKIHYLFSANSTKGQARNLGIATAKNRFVAFIDDDCIASDDWIERIKHKINNNFVFIQGQTDNGDESNIWSTLENATLHVYKNLPDRHSLMNGAGIKLDAENLVINLARIPFHPMFIESPHRYIHDDYLFLLKLNRMGYRPIYDDSILVEHMPNSSWLDYVKKLIIDGRSDYWKAFMLKKKNTQILRHFKSHFRVSGVRDYPFNQRMEHEVFSYINRMLPTGVNIFTFYFFWKLKPYIRNIGFAIEAIYHVTSQSKDIEHYLMT